MPLRAPLVPSSPWKGKRVVLGVTGGIACYKSVTLARDLARLGAEVDVVLTESAQAFLKPLVFEGVTGRPVLTSLWSSEGSARHLRMAGEADAVVVAPATADFMARAAAGRAEDLLSTLLLATRAPVLLAPAMNDRMWSHPQTERNAVHLESVCGYRVVGPDIGPLAAGEGEGPGRMVEPEHLRFEVGRALGRRRGWAGSRVLVTAGPTREPLDAVRYLGNRSSGHMGVALALEAWLRGAHVTLVMGPGAHEVPATLQDMEVVRVETAREMRDAVVHRVASAADAAEHPWVQMFAAAVSDFRPADPMEGKRKRGEGERWTVTLEENPDVARESLGVGSPAPSGGSPDSPPPPRLRRPLRLGFALETRDLLDHARAKLESKGFDWIVANPAGESEAGFDAATNRGWLLSRSEPGSPLELPLDTKEGMARTILDQVEVELVRRSDAGNGE